MLTLLVRRVPAPPAPGSRLPRGSRLLLSRYTSPDFLYIRSWLPCIFFSGGVTVGNIGRQLAMVCTVVTWVPNRGFQLHRLSVHDMLWLLLINI